MTLPSAIQCSRLPGSTLGVQLACRACLKYGRFCDALVSGKNRVDASADTGH